MRRIRYLVLHFVVVWIIEAFSLLAMTVFIPGIRIADTPSIRAIDVAMAAALVLGLINVLVRPLLLLLTLPITMMTLGLSTLVINALMLALTAYILPNFLISSFGAALAGAISLAAANTVLTRLTTIDDDNSFFEGLVERLSQHRHDPDDGGPGRGLVFLEIDGLSYAGMKRAVEQGVMPTVREMLRDGTHLLSRFDCGLPSQTSSCQAGILYGDNADIPAFRWYDKERRKLMVSNNFRDAAELDSRYARGHGLLRGGSSINNLLAGDAAKTLLTMCTLTDDVTQLVGRRQEDLYLLLLNPYIYMRSIVLSVWEILVELFQGLRQRIRNVQPRVSRLHRGYPFLRAITNVFLRDIATYMVALDVVRGVPCVYTTFVGYDEVAHYAGPGTPDAMNTLRALDHQIRRIRRLIARKAPRPYDLIMLSDHGQSTGATFRQRYGKTLTELIAGLIAPETRIAEAQTTRSSASYTAALVAELKGVEARQVAGRLGRVTLKRTRQTLENQSQRHALAPAALDAEVTVCASGNLANVYFNLRDSKVPLSELNAAHPGLVDALVEHPGIGFVIAYDDDGNPVVLGKTGARDLSTGAITGFDPLLPFGDPDLRGKQLLRMAQFPHAGDLILNSTLYPDGHVASFEEMVGSHGGLGGDQTEAFLLHPPDMHVPPIINSTEVFGLLNARRNLPVPLSQPAPARPSEVDSWSPGTLWIGLANWRVCAARVSRALRLDRAVFREVARDPYATGPALLILAAVISTRSLLASLRPGLLGLPGTLFANDAVTGVAAWLAATLAAHTAGRLLGGRGQLIGTFRAMMFALVFQVFGLLWLIPVLGPLLRITVSILSLIAAWMAVQEALDLRGRAALLIPFGFGLVVALGIVAVDLVVSGLGISIESILFQLGIAPSS